MKLSYLAAGLAIIAIPALGMPPDTPIPVQGGEAVCTGIGSAKNDPRWAAYPVRVVFSNGGAQFVAGEHIVVTGGGHAVATLDCDAPWVLLKLPAGDYAVTATLSGQAEPGQAGSGQPGARPRTVSFHTGGRGPQQRVEVQFPRLVLNH